MSSETWLSPEDVVELTGRIRWAAQCRKLAEMAMLKQAAALRTSLDIGLLEFIQSEINERVYSEITVKLLNLGRVHPFSVGLAAPYLFKRLAWTVASSSMPDELAKKMYPESEMSKDALVA